jgi:hypothetical protein
MVCFYMRLSVLLIEAIGFEPMKNKSMNLQFIAFDRFATPLMIMLLDYIGLEPIIFRLEVERFTIKLTAQRKCY